MQEIARRMRALGRKRAEAMRDKARTAALKRKEEYLGARVPKELREKVIAKAERMGIPVSILLRNILEEAFPGDDGGSGARSEGGRNRSRLAAGVRGRLYPGVIGWEEITLNRAMDCSGCALEIDAGSEVLLGLAVPGEDHVILCAKCKERA